VNLFAVGYPTGCHRWSNEEERGEVCNIIIFDGLQSIVTKCDEERKRVLYNHVRSFMYDPTAAIKHIRRLKLFGLVRRSAPSVLVLCYIHQMNLVK